MTFLAEWYVDTGFNPVVGTGTYRRYALHENGTVYRLIVDPLHGSLWKKAS